MVGSVWKSIVNGTGIFMISAFPDFLFNHLSKDKGEVPDGATEKAVHIGKDIIMGGLATKVLYDIQASPIYEMADKQPLLTGLGIAAAMVGIRYTAKTIDNYIDNKKKLK